jgi:hypothetical protein
MRNLKGKLSLPHTVYVETVGITDYDELVINKPKINGVELKGNKTLEDLGEETITNQELKDIIDNQFEVIFGGN